MRLIDAFLPIWILTAIGYLARRRGVLGETAAMELGGFVFYLAMPAALFLTMAATPVSHLDGRPLAAFAASAVAVIAVSWLVLSRRFAREPAARPIWGMAAGYVNSANLGIPIARQVLGSVSFLAQVVLLQNLVVTPVILLALDRRSGAAGRLGFRQVVALPLRTPVIGASLLGLIWSIARLHVPAQLAGSLSLLSGAAVPTALIALGASLHRERSTDQGTAPVPEVSAITALKLAGQPLIAYLACLALNVTGKAMLTAVLIAGLPTAQNTFIFAQRYGVAQALANRAVIITTTLSLATLALIAVLLTPS